MKPLPADKVCAICGHTLQMLKNGRPEAAFRFPALLAKLGKAGGEYAHPSCVMQLTDKSAAARGMNLKPPAESD